MRRIVSACLQQTMRFDSVNGEDTEAEFKMLCSGLDKKNIKYRIDDKQKKSDGSLVVQIKKQYNSYKTDCYMQ